MYSIITLLSYYWIIIFSIIGYGVFFDKYFLRAESRNIGFIGIYGIFSLSLISYFSSFFLPHTQIFNSVVLLLGIINFFINKHIFDKNLKKLLIIFGFLIIFIFISKNHDDFPYYHFPYTHLLTEYSGMIGLGNFTHGFKTPSSIFYLSSLWNLPFVEYYLFHLSPVFFLGFSNFILFNKIEKFLKNNDTNYILYLSLLCIIFINIFFYRLAEHGSDRSAMILIIVLVIELLHLTNKRKNILNESLFLKLFILITLIISLKIFYILYVILLLPILINFINKKSSLLFFIKHKVTYLCLVFILILFTVSFFNTGCLIYPVKTLCFEKYSWAIPLSEVELLSDWYQQWAKGGASPNYRVENPSLYIQNFNWVKNWFDVYFFNKVSDYLLGLLFLSLIVFSIFFSKKIKKTTKPKFMFVYLILILLTFEWFYFHPALRYGGYHLIALLIFIPLSIFLSKYVQNKNFFKKKIYTLFVLTIFIFFMRNINRLVNEYELYNYNILNNSYYRTEGQKLSISNRIKNINECKVKSINDKCKNDPLKNKQVNIFNIYHKDN
jgi:hypothetical protein